MHACSSMPQARACACTHVAHILPTNAHMHAHVCCLTATNPTAPVGQREVKEVSEAHTRTYAHILLGCDKPHRTCKFRDSEGGVSDTMHVTRTHTYAHTLLDGDKPHSPCRSRDGEGGV